MSPDEMARRLRMLEERVEHLLRLLAAAKSELARGETTARAAVVKR